MQLINAPAKIPLPFATNGAYNTIPESASSTPGLASLSTGFPAITMEPVASGGIPPAGQDFNGILLLISAISRWANAGAGFVYDNTFATDTNVGGYPQGARVLRSDGLGYWFNTVDNNQVNPETSATAAIAAGWVPDFTTGAAAITMTNANVTLTPLQYGHPIIIITGTLSANLQLVFPTGVTDSWVIVNKTTGSYTIAAKTSGGTGVTLPGISQVISDGTNIYSATSGTGSANGIVGDARNLFTQVTSTTATSITYTADEVDVKYNLGGGGFTLANYNQTLNTTTTGAGGMDNGSLPNPGFVAVYAIYNPTTNTQSILGQDVTAAVATSVYSGAYMPAGYTVSALISVWPASGGYLGLGCQLGKQISFPNKLAYSGSSPVAQWGTLSIASIVPKNAKSIGGFGGQNNNSSSAQTCNFGIASDTNGSGQQGGSIGLTSSTGQTMASSFNDLLLPTPQTVYYYFYSSTGGFTSTTINITSYTI